jgi:hypothetical protein
MNFADEMEEVCMFVMPAFSTWSGRFQPLKSQGKFCESKTCPQDKAVEAVAAMAAVWPPKQGQLF